MEKQPPTTFKGGKYIFGTQSGAYGVIEETSAGRYSTNNILFVKTLFGKFLPGETLRDEDANTAKIAAENGSSDANFNIGSLFIKCG